MLREKPEQGNCMKLGSPRADKLGDWESHIHTIIYKTDNQKVDN